MIVPVIDRQKTQVAAARLRALAGELAAGAPITHGAMARFTRQPRTLFLPDARGG
jgi:hypothetical protein